MEAKAKGGATDSHMGENPVVESGDQFAFYITPLFKQPPMASTSFHAPMEDRVDIPTKYVPNVPFWRTSMGQAISKFGVHRPSPEHPSLAK